jgi:hypothetical protein
MGAAAFEAHPRRQRLQENSVRDNEFLQEAIGFFIGCAAVALVIFSILGGWALIVHNGQAQVCETSGGHWIATDDPGTGVGDTGSVHRMRECKR